MGSALHKTIVNCREFVTERNERHPQPSATRWQEGPAPAPLLPRTLHSSFSMSCWSLVIWAIHWLSASTQMPAQGKAEGSLQAQKTAKASELQNQETFSPETLPTAQETHEVLPRPGLLFLGTPGPTPQQTRSRCPVSLLSHPAWAAAGQGQGQGPRAHSPRLAGRCYLWSASRSRGPSGTGRRSSALCAHTASLTSGPRSSPTSLRPS